MEIRVKTKNIGSIFLIAVVITLFFAGISQAREKRERVRWVRSRTGLASLTTLSRDRGHMERHLKNETRNYDRLMQDIERGLLSEGQDAGDIREKYGDPVVDFQGQGGKAERWVYKPFDSTFFQGPKVSLFFGKERDLTGWSIYEKRGCPE